MGVRTYFEVWLQKWRHNIELFNYSPRRHTLHLFLNLCDSTEKDEP